MFPDRHRCLARLAGSALTLALSGSLAACSVTTPEGDAPVPVSPSSETHDSLPTPVGRVVLLDRAEDAHALQARYRDGDGAVCTLRIEEEPRPGAPSALRLSVRTSEGEGFELVSDRALVPASQALQLFELAGAERRPVPRHAMPGLTHPPRVERPRPVARRWAETRAILLSARGREWLFDLAPDETDVTSPGDHGCDRANDRFWEICSGPRSLEDCDEALMDLIRCFFIFVVY